MGAFVIKKIIWIKLISLKNSKWPSWTPPPEQPCWFSYSPFFFLSQFLKAENFPVSSPSNLAFAEKSPPLEIVTSAQNLTRKMCYPPAYYDFLVCIHGQTLTTFFWISSGFLLTTISLLIMTTGMQQKSSPIKIFYLI